MNTPARTTLVLRTLDAADRTHARVAMRLHDARNSLRERIETILDHTRERITRLDAASADAVNRLQGVVGGAIEKARARAA